MKVNNKIINISSNNSLYDDDINDKKTSKNKEFDKDSSIFNEIEYGVSINDSVIYLHGDIQMGYLFDLISKIRIVLANRPAAAKNDPINIIINSNGGDVYESLGIIDYMNTLQVPVNVIARGRAMSAAAMILCCATGIRAAAKSTTIMVHEASAEIFGKSADIKSNTDHIVSLETSFYKMMSEKTKMDQDFWEKACRKDYYMSAEKALEFGLIDQII